MRDDFLADAEVCALAEWLAARLGSLPVQVNLPASPYAPLGLQANTTFGQLIPEHYRWRSTGMIVGDWRETMELVARLSRSLRRAVAAGDAAATLAACDAIAQWGADRNSRVGGGMYLRSLGAQLPTYLRRTRDAMRLAAPDRHATFDAVPRMNSTLCRIHALHAADGLPLYESRIAGAIAMLVELWRRDTGRAAAPLPGNLSFPAVGGERRRRLTHIAPRAADPGLLNYNPGTETATASRWAHAAVRLGLLIQKVLQLCDRGLFVAEPGRAGLEHPTRRATAFTASLFIAGYDPRCLLPDDAGLVRLER